VLFEHDIGVVWDIELIMCYHNIWHSPDLVVNFTPKIAIALAANAALQDQIAADVLGYDMLISVVRFTAHMGTEDATTLTHISFFLRAERFA